MMMNNLYMAGFAFKKWITPQMVAVDISVTSLVHRAGSTSKPANRVKFCPIGA